MATLTVEGKQYDVETLSDEAKALMNSITFTDNKIAQLESELAMARTARNSYVQQLVAALPKEDQPVKKNTTRKRAASTKATPKKAAAPRTREKTADSSDT